MSLRIAMAVQGARMVSEDSDHVAFEHVRYGVPIRFVETGSVLARTVRTTVHARFLVPAGPVFEIRQRMLPLGRADTDLGDLRVASSRPRSTRALLGRRGAAILASLGRGATLSSDGSQVTLTLAGQIAATRVAEVAELMIAVGEADIFGLSELRALPGAVYHAPSGDYDHRTRPWVEVHLPTRVELAPVSVRGVAQTWAGRAYDHAAPFTIAIVAGRLMRPIPDVPLADDHRRHLGALGAGTLAAREGVLTFTWAGVETNRERLLAGARLLASFPAAFTTGVYR